MSGAEKDGRRVEREVQRKEKCEDSCNYEWDYFGEDVPCRKQHEKGDKLHRGRHDERFADLGRDHFIARVHGVGSERGAAGERDIQRDGGQKGDSPDDGCDKHG